MSGSWQEAATEIEQRLDYLIAAVQGGMPESWDEDAAAESLIIDYVRVLERRVLALGGSLERVPEDEDGAPLPNAGDSPQVYAAAVRGGPELADRRQRALEALHDARSAIRELPAEVDPVMVAIETATRVRITPEIVDAAATTAGRGFGFDLGAAIKAAFEAAGFEVEQ